MCSHEHFLVSIPRTQIRLIHCPAQGIIQEHFEAHLGVTEGMTRCGDTFDTACDRIVQRVYGDIAVDFEEFLRLTFPCNAPEGRAADVCALIRAKLRADGPSTGHKAP